MSTIIKKQKKHVCLVKWRKRIAQAKEDGYFSKQVKDLAGDWNYCAVGEGQSKLAKSIVAKAFVNGGRRGWMSYTQIAPMDLKLETLGGKFSEYVSDNKFYNASRALNAIERRLNKLYVLV